MPSFSRPLEDTLHRAVALANARSHEYATLEHLLLALVEDPDASAVMSAGTAPVYNLGNNDPVKLMDFIAAIERAAGRKARMEMKPKPAGDVLRTYADIALAERDLGFRPATRLEDGIADFVQWFRGYNG